MQQKMQKLLKDINTFTNKIYGLYDLWAKKHNANSYAVAILYDLVMGDKLIQRQISENYGCAKQTINNIILSLKQDGYIELKSCEADKREKEVLLTQKGSSYANKLLAPLIKIEQNICERIGLAGMNEYFKTMKQFSEYFSEELENESD